MAEKLVTLEEIREAQRRIEGVAVKTGLYRLDPARMAAAGFDAISADGPEIYIKAESEQPIGSFKLRGAYNKVSSLDAETLQRGVITYSSGNHAQGVGYAARALKSKAVIVMPDNAPYIKRDATAALGAEIVLVGPASAERKIKAEELESEHGYTMVPPYDDRFVIAGQATCGVEIVDQLPDVELVIAPVSGGGLLSGVATAVKYLSPKTQIWGAEPALAGDAKESFDTKHLVEWPAAKTTQTIADGLRTQSLGESNFAHILQNVDGIISVTEDEILQAIRIYLLATDLVPEPSGAVTLAAALFHWRELPQVKRVAIVLSGGNLDPALRDDLLKSK